MLTHVSSLVMDRSILVSRERGHDVIGGVDGNT
jgi:hypothetical protein